MDTLRGAFDAGEPAASAEAGDDRDWDVHDDDGQTSDDLPPHAIGQDERRMQVRAYNHWASLLGEQMFPLIDDLDPASLPDFGPYSVVLDFSFGIENPAVRFLGHKLAHECGTDGAIASLSDVPPRSLLSRITDHYMQIIANQAPIGFEAEFVNQRGQAILYRGILLPYSSDNRTIDFIYGVINWKEMADQATADELLLEIDQALELDFDDELNDEPAPELLRRETGPVTHWADSPAHEDGEVISPTPVPTPFDDFMADFDKVASFADARDDADPARDLPLPDFGKYTLDDDYDEEFDEDGEYEDDSASGYNFASLADYIEAPAKKAIDPAEFELDENFAEEVADDAPVHAVGYTEEAADADAIEDLAPAFIDDLPVDAGLYDCLAAARELAHVANTTEDRSRSALYAAVGRAYDFSLAAQESPADFAELIADSGLAVQDRAPMTPVVKLVFGHDYDKTRLTEYAAVLTHAHRIGLERGALAGFLTAAEGGLKGVVRTERRLRREEAGKPALDEAGVRAALAAKLRELEALTWEALEGAGPEFALVLVRRDETGSIAVLGELPEDIPLIERAARKLVG